MIANIYDAIGNLETKINFGEISNDTSNPLIAVDDNNLIAIAYHQLGKIYGSRFDIAKLDSDLKVKINTPPEYLKNTTIHPFDLDISTRRDFITLKIAKPSESMGEFQFPQQEGVEIGEKYDNIYIKISKQNEENLAEKIKTYSNSIGFSAAEGFNGRLSFSISVDDGQTIKSNKDRDFFENSDGGTEKIEIKGDIDKEQKLITNNIRLLNDIEDQIIYNENDNEISLVGLLLAEENNDNSQYILEIQKPEGISLDSDFEETKDGTSQVQETIVELIKN